MRPYLIILAFITIAAVWLGWTLYPKPVPPPVALRPELRNGSQVSVMGAASCSAQACHGRLDPAPNQSIQQNEYSTWVMHDKHALAYEVLFDERSADIMKKLGGGAASQDKRCLVCHSRADAEITHPNEPARPLNCESCHGGAERWLGPHTTKVWQAKSADAKLEFGMKPVHDPLRLARTCAACHVGAPPDEERGLPARDVNHDLIAAGHPSLQFEFAAYFANMPPHWNTSNRKNDPAQAARQWAVGQAVTAQAALDLLAYRAGNDESPWPEFAEYDCFACHHDLQSPAWRQNPGRRGTGKAGALPWGGWFHAMPYALAMQQREGDPIVLEKIGGLMDEMAKRRPPRKVVAEQAQALSRDLTPWLGRLAKQDFDRDFLVRLLTTLDRDPRKFLAHVDGKEGALVADWQVAAQFYLAAAALDSKDPAMPFVDNLAAMLGQLQFSTNSPAGYGSPRDFDSRQFGGELRKLRTRTAIPK